MYSNTIFSSVQSEKRWILAMEKNFPQQHTLDIDFDTPPCVLRVPKIFTESKPEAYAPHHVGLGPYHHLRPDLYITHNQKLAAITKFLPPEKLQKIRVVVEALVQCEPLLRACYNEYLDLDIQTLAWILAIDGLYLLQFLKNYSAGEMAGDILMLENQIPVTILQKIRNVLHLDASLFEEFNAFCEDQSLLKSSNHVIGNINQVHLLEHMYNMILNNTSIQESYITTYSMGITRIAVSDVVDAVQFLAERGVPAAGTAAQLLSFVENIPWQRILGLFKKEQDPSVEEIDIPSVSQMTEIAGIKFKIAAGGIREIKFDEEEKIFYLPAIRLNATSEVMIRNLVAYETAMGKQGSILELAEYVDLMCGIIDSPMDVDILRKEEIIESELADEEIARIFNGISKSTNKNKVRSNVVEATDNVNTRYDSICSVKVKRFVVKYGCGLLKLMSLVMSIAVLVVLILRAYCSVFGCSSYFSSGKITAQKPNLLFSYQ